MSALPFCQFLVQLYIEIGSGSRLAFIGRETGRTVIPPDHTVSIRGIGDGSIALCINSNEPGSIIAYLCDQIQSIALGPVQIAIYAMEGEGVLDRTCQNIQSHITHKGLVVGGTDTVGGDGAHFHSSTFANQYHTFTDLQLGSLAEIAGNDGGFGLGGIFGKAGLSGILGKLRLRDLNIAGGRTKLNAKVVSVCGLALVGREAGALDIPPNLTGSIGGIGDDGIAGIIKGHIPGGIVVKSGICLQGVVGGPVQVAVRTVEGIGAFLRTFSNLKYVATGNILGIGSAYTVISDRGHLCGGILANENNGIAYRDLVKSFCRRDGDGDACKDRNDHSNGKHQTESFLHHFFSFSEYICRTEKQTNIPLSALL